METEAALSALGALGQSTRLDVIRLLIRHEADGLAAGELARRLSVAQNTLSAHLNVLTRANLVTSQRRSRSIIYRAQVDKLELLMLFLLEHCCDESPDVRALVMDRITRRLPAKPKGR